MGINEEKLLAVLEVLEEMIVDAFQLPVDTPTLIHPYWGRVLRVVAKARDETPLDTMIRILMMVEDKRGSN